MPISAVSDAYKQPQCRAIHDLVAGARGASMLVGPLVCLMSVA
jgi:hypothetical protein